MGLSLYRFSSRNLFILHHISKSAAGASVSQSPLSSAVQRWAVNPVLKRCGYIFILSKELLCFLFFFLTLETLCT